MVTTDTTIKVPPDSDLSRTLEAARATGQPVRVDTGERVCTLVLAETEDAAEDVFAHYDPERVLTALRAARGALAGVDTERLLADLAEQREQDSRGRPG